jgi:hypothetical protein
LADQLRGSAHDLATKLTDERKVSISARDIARYMLGLEGTEHVRQALEGKPVTLPPASATAVTSAVTPPLNVTANVTAFDRLVCNFCRKRWGEVEHMLIIAGRNAHGVVAVCNECSKDDVTEDVTQDDV